MIIPLTEENREDIERNLADGEPFFHAAAVRNLLAEIDRLRAELAAKAEPPARGFVGSPEQAPINHDLSFDPKPESPPASHGETQRVIRETAAPMIRKAIGGLLFRLNDNGSLELRDEDGVIDGIDCVEIVRAAVSK